MALSYEAFCECVRHNVEVIYVDMDIYQECANDIEQKLKEYHYNSLKYMASKGMFFTRNKDISSYEIWDPYRLF